MGTRNLCDAAIAAGAQALVMISTDKAVNPTNVMGATKRAAESYLQARALEPEAGGPHPDFVAVRFGNVLGSAGSVVPLFERQLKAGGPLTVTHRDIERYFMTIREAVQLVLQASAYGVAHDETQGRVFVLDMGRPVKIVDLARQMIRLAGLRPELDIKIEFTGLRPGEKMTEELFHGSEEVGATGIPRVNLAAPRTLGLEAMAGRLADLERACAGADRDAALAILREIAPEWTSGSAAT